MAMYDENESATIDISGAEGAGEPNLSEDLEFWMTRLPSRLRALPIVHLAIPGSHNTMTYTIERNNDVGPDEPEMIRTIAQYASVFTKPVIFNWSINQHESVKEQLNGGIRYIDLRVASKPNTNKIYFLHGLYGTEIEQPLKEIAEWLSGHPNEIVIIDFQHFYDFSEDHHRNLINYITFLFRGRLCPVYGKFDHISLQWMNSERYQIFLIYRNLIAKNYSNLWPSGLWPTPWPNTISTRKLIDFLNDHLEKRDRGLGFVSQCLLTPDTPYIMRHVCGNLQRDLGVKCWRVTLPWIQEKSPGNGGLNIIITDYVSLNNFLFSKTVIQRNASLLRPNYLSELHIKD